MNDIRLENIIGHLLRAGVLLAAVVVFAGGILYLIQDGSQAVNYWTFIAGGQDIRTLRGIVKLAAHFDSRGLMQLGLLLLIATPVARVVMAIAGFALERDRLYVVVSSIVLAVLLFSLLHAT
jgi:uncharacterized membrane protein